MSAFLGFDIETTGLSPREHRIVATGFSLPDAVISVGIADKPEDEPRIIASALTIIAAQIASPEPVVTWAGASFDFPFLAYRALVHRIRIPFPMDSVLRRYVRKPHADLCAILTNWNPRKGDTMNAFAASLGISVTDETTGADVPKMVEQGDWDGVRAHLTSDLETLHAIGTRCRHVGLI